MSERSDLEIIRQYIDREIHKHQEVIETLGFNVNNLPSELASFEQKAKFAQSIIITKESLLRHQGALLALNDIIERIDEIESGPTKEYVDQ